MVIKKNTDMKTITPSPIGSAFRRSRGILIASSLVGILAVGLDMLLFLLGVSYWDYEPALVLGAAAVLGFMAKWDRASLGLRMPSVRRSGYLIKIALFLGGIVSLFSICALGLLWLLDVPIDLRLFTHRSQLLPWLWSACILAPVFQEGMYRFALCTPLAALLGRWGAILISGAAFSALHFVYGIPGPDNLIAGFLLAWVYLKTRSILVPIILHSLGNLCVFVFQVIVYYPNGG